MKKRRVGLDLIEPIFGAESPDDRYLLGLSESGEVFGLHTSQ
jgi:hypothetical protein